MSIIAEKIFETVKTLPEQQAEEVLDFAEFLQSKMEQHSHGNREKALAALDKRIGLYDGAPFNREELTRLHDLKAFFAPFQKDLTGFKFDREEANAR